MQAILKTPLILTALLPFCVSAKISVENATVFATQSPDEPSAIFMNLHNDGKEPVNLAFAQSTRAARLELHGTQHGKMLTLSGIEIPANGNVQLKRGGLHIMVFEAAKTLRAGEKFPLELMFDNGERVEVEANVVGH
ncbi:TerC protein [Aggregatibacter actinomycetemcomitans serotype e str. SC1083]|uniref:TerC protein n=1 Tax=Aggregatibacter actinomycetemcomitans serotype e str. SC1083 TaxID=907488 RepID=G4A5H3_AGGAC|nr:copper chaperone PCu(A)C [Aggregatibacter actinomycetemcomitans]EGY35363.1 TerC protein [Aggregatibacter actinomycetemcomitans serotype e str. SC1083]KYK76182.1 molecular chaperone [Aggregatibacter actinomycetemcomitans serotype e str. SA3096]KYK79236.1 molecular chaperone [Aggregatibacter actinomycetemcomitans serotype e str. SC936]KYK92911.1 molecular chaperone [Aggregatibacter actinomycetemcomitans serotype e str. ANH9776]MBN6071250.1 copper chaperone PCu(A)C [Aggregatibacter actinomycet